MCSVVLVHNKYSSVMFIKNHLFYIICLLFSNTTAEAKNILVLEEIASPSHNLWLHPVLRTLTEQGAHNVTVLTSNPKIYSTTSVNSNLHYIYLEAVYSTIYNSSDHSFNYLDIGDTNVFLQLFSYYEFSIACCKGSINSLGWQTLLHYPDDFKFDLVLHDYTAGSCQLGFLHKFGYPPLISITAFNDIFLGSLMIGNILIPSIVTHYTFKELKTYCFWDRLENYLLQISDYLLRKYYFLPMETKLLENSMNDDSVSLSVEQLMKRTKLILINSHPAIDMIQYYPSNVIGVGGLHIEPVKSLPEDIFSIMNNSKNGIILFSLGTNIRIDMLGTKVVNQIIQAFKKLSAYEFIWKIDGEPLGLSMPKNVHVRRWVPQNDILGHPNTKLFITHAGILSVQESTWHGVPMLGIPIFADQFMNIEKSIRLGVAERLYIKDLTSDNLFHLIKKMLLTSSYRDNMKIRSTNFRDQKETGLDRAIFWIEWVLRNPNSTQFDSIGSNLNLIQRQSIDVILFLTILAIILFYIIYFICKYLFNYCLNRKIKYKYN